MNRKILKETISNMDTAYPKPLKLIFPTLIYRNALFMHQGMFTNT